MLDDDFVKLFAGKLKPQDAFMNGKMKIRGNMAKAMKFNPSVLPKGAKLWISNCNEDYGCAEKLSLKKDYFSQALSFL